MELRDKPIRAYAVCPQCRRVYYRPTTLRAERDLYNHFKAVHPTLIADAMKAIGF